MKREIARLNVRTARNERSMLEGDASDFKSGGIRDRIVCTIG